MNNDTCVLRVLNMTDGQVDGDHACGAPAAGTTYAGLRCCAECGAELIKNSIPPRTLVQWDEPSKEDWVDHIPKEPLPDTGCKDIQPGEVWAFHFRLEGDQKIPFISAVVRVDGPQHKHDGAPATLLAGGGGLMWEGRFNGGSTAARHARLIRPAPGQGSDVT